MMKVIPKLLTIMALLTLLLNVLLPVLLWATHRSNTTRDLSDPYVHEAYVEYMGLEFTTFASQDTAAIFGVAVWTTLLALGYLYRDRFPVKKLDQ